MFWLVGFDIRDQRLTFSLEKKKKNQPAWIGLS